jgi:hypothetical protein
MSSSAENDPLHARLQEFLKRNLEPGGGFAPQTDQPSPEEVRAAPVKKNPFEFNRPSNPARKIRNRKRRQGSALNST